MRRWIVGSLVLGVGVIAASNGLRGDQPKDAAASPVVNGDLKTFRKARVEAARELIAELQIRVEADEPLTPEFIQLQADSYKRLADAEVAAAEDPRDRIAAAEQYVERCGQILKLLESRFIAKLDVSKVQVWQAKYQLADAQCMLAELKTQ